MRILNLIPSGLTDYSAVNDFQHALHDQVASGQAEDTLIVAEFAPAWTAGRHTKPEDIPDSTVPIIHVDRAGSATWHGPGQVVIYPIVRLQEPVDLYAWIRSVENGVLQTLRKEWGLPVERIEGRAGVWLRGSQGRDRKICAIGLKVARGAGLHTVCAEAGCPNIYECWEDREATFLLGGAICTRRCDFCDIATGRPTEYDRDEPRRIAESVAQMGLRYATITGVTRDDLPDGAAWLYAETTRQIRAKSPGTGIELLVDDFRGSNEAIDMVIEAAPQVFAHNLETVPRIFKKIRPAFRYERSLAMIQRAHDGGMVTKSNLILGMGETREEIIEAMRDLHESGCDLLTLTQYLRPSPLHHPIDRWVHPEEFIELSAEAEAMGFAGVMAGPLVRSSYRAGLLWAKGMRARGFEIPAHLAHIENSGSTLQEAGSVLDRLKKRQELHRSMAAAQSAQ